MVLFRKPIHLRFLAMAILGGTVFGWGGLGRPAQIGPSPAGTAAPNLASTGNVPSSVPGIAETNLDETISKMREGVKQQLSFLPPFTKKQLVKAIKHHKKHLNKVQRRVKERGLAFDLTPGIKAELRKAGAVKNFIAGLNPYTPSARAKVSVNALQVGSKVSGAEVKAYRQLKSQSDPDKRIRGAKAFVQRFPKSALLSYVYALQAGAYWEKDDASNVVSYCEKSLAINAQNLIALLLASSALPQPQMLKNISNTEKEKRLNLAESYAKQALQALDRLGRGEMASGVYASLGMVYLERSLLSAKKPDSAELSKAEQSFQKAIERPQGSRNAADYFRLGDIYSLENKFDAAVSAYSHAKRLAPGSVVGRLAARHIRDLRQKQPRGKTPQS